LPSITAPAHILGMQVLVNHISYVLMTLLAGVVIGWKTYPAYSAFLSRLRGEDERARETVRVRRPRQ
jgi:hypothetical protein